MSNPQPLRKLTIAPGETYHDRLDAPALSKRDARLRRYLADLPAADEQAYRLCEREIVALRTAWACGAGEMRCEETFRAELFREGMADKGGYLTAFGMAVRRAAMVVDT